VRAELTRIRNLYVALTHHDHEAYRNRPALYARTSPCAFGGVPMDIRALARHGISLACRAVYRNQPPYRHSCYPCRYGMPV